MHACRPVVSQLRATFVALQRPFRNGRSLQILDILARLLSLPQVVCVRLPPIHLSFIRRSRLCSGPSMFRLSLPMPIWLPLVPAALRYPSHSSWRFLIINAWPASVVTCCFCHLQPERAEHPGTGDVRVHAQGGGAPSGQTQATYSQARLLHRYLLHGRLPKPCLCSHPSIHPLGQRTGSGHVGSRLLVAGSRNHEQEHCQP